MTIEITLDPDRLDAFMGQFVTDIGAALRRASSSSATGSASTRPWPAAGPLTPAELAARHRHRRALRPRVAPRPGRRRLRHLRPEHGTLPPHRPSRRCALADEDSPAFVAGRLPDRVRRRATTEPAREAFRTGQGVGWHEHARRPLPRHRALLPPGLPRQPGRAWLPALDGVVDQARGRRDRGRRRLRPRRLDHPHGPGLPAAPRSSASTTTRRPSPRRRSARRRPGSPTASRFEVASAATFPGRQLRPGGFFDCLHDMGDPVGGGTARAADARRRTARG